jgi:alkanesulfonate monooxygenase SsuD/methylene tetrahydromethanopterin reductase-like flavin-dependent oxidoreductase (luciferase family)
MTAEDIEFGLDTLVYVTVDESGRPLDGDVVIRNTIEEDVLADAVGIESFNVGEHYQPEMMDSAGRVMLAAIAGRTERIRLGTAVTDLSTQDPVRVYTEFATLDAVSNGRAQLIVGRGSPSPSRCSETTSPTTRPSSRRNSTYSPPLRSQPVTWSGTVRPPLTEQYLSPALPEGHLPTWVAVAGAAAARGTVMGLSSFASKPVEEVVAANPKTFLQLYWVGRGRR